LISCVELSLSDLRIIPAAEDGAGSVFLVNSSIYFSRITHLLDCNAPSKWLWYQNESTTANYLQITSNFFQGVMRLSLSSKQVLNAENQAYGGAVGLMHVGTSNND